MRLTPPYSHDSSTPGKSSSELTSYYATELLRRAIACMLWSTKLNQKRVPRLYSDSNCSPMPSGLNSYANWWLINKPKPTPVLFKISFSWFSILPNVLKRCGLSWSRIPIPVSATSTSITDSATRYTESVIDPLSVNFKAFPIRLTMIYFTRLGSVTMIALMLVSYFKRNLRFLLLTINWNISRHSEASELRLNSIKLIWNLPTFIWAWSSRSFERLRKYLELSRAHFM